MLKKKSNQLINSFFNPAGGSGDTATRVHLSIQTESEASGFAGAGQEATGRHQRDRQILPPAWRAGKDTEACRYSATDEEERVLL